MDPTLQRSIFTIRRWWWLIVLVSLVAAGGAYLVTRQVADRTYVARASTMVGQVTVPVSGSGLDELRLNQSLVPTYAALARKDVILAPVAQELGLTDTTEQLADSIAAETPKDTQLIDIVVSRRQRAQAVQIANAVVDHLVALSNDAADPNRDAAEARMAELKEKIVDAETQVETLSAEYLLTVPAGGANFSAVDQAALLQRINLLQSNVQMWWNDVRDLEAIVADGGTPRVTVLERAATAEDRTTQSPAKNALLGGVAGLLLGVFLAFLLDYAGTEERS
jgi:capsular polysaccharide biosynthesis protein